MVVIPTLIVLLWFIDVSTNSLMDISTSSDETSLLLPKTAAHEQDEACCVIEKPTFKSPQMKNVLCLAGKTLTRLKYVC